MMASREASRASELAAARAAAEAAAAQLAPLRAAKAAKEAEAEALSTQVDPTTVIPLWLHQSTPLLDCSARLLDHYSSYHSHRSDRPRPPERQWSWPYNNSIIVVLEGGATAMLNPRDDYTNAFSQFIIINYTREAEVLSTQVDRSCDRSQSCSLDKKQLRALPTHPRFFGTDAVCTLLFQLATPEPSPAPR